MEKRNGKMPWKNAMEQAKVSKTAYDRRQLQSATDAILDTRDLCARARLVVHESQQLLQQIDDLYRSATGSLLRKNKYVVDP
jgi:hypothetical protein